MTQISLPVGKRYNLFEESERQSSVLFLEKPIIDNQTIASIKNLNATGMKTKVISTLIKLDRKNNFSLSDGIKNLREECEKSINEVITYLYFQTRSLKKAIYLY